MAGVFPVFVTGHHCGAVSAVVAAVETGVFPVFVTGPHCGLFTVDGVGGGASVTG